MVIALCLYSTEGTFLICMKKRITHGGHGCGRFYWVWLLRCVSGCLLGRS